MIRLAIVVEGPTEEAFVKDVLVDSLLQRKVEPCPILIGRARGRSRGGGGVDVTRLVSDMVRLHYSYDAVTSLVDFYGFRGKGSRTVEELEEHLVQELRTRIPNTGRTFPYVQKHEFEGLLFSDPGAFRAIMQTTEHNIVTHTAVRRQLVTPEDINDDPNRAPSMRIVKVLSGYRKSLHGPLVAKETGLDTIRAECPRFRTWLTRLEGLGSNGRAPPHALAVVGATLAICTEPVNDVDNDYILARVRT